MGHIRDSVPVHVGRALRYVALSLLVATGTAQAQTAPAPYYTLNLPSDQILYIAGVLKDQHLAYDDWMKVSALLNLIQGQINAQNEARQAAASKAPVSASAGAAAPAESSKPAAPPSAPAAPAAPAEPAKKDAPPP